jgi:hypothetical protein
VMVGGVPHKYAPDKNGTWRLKPIGPAKRKKAAAPKRPSTGGSKVAKKKSKKKGASKRKHTVARSIAASSAAAPKRKRTKKAKKAKRVGTRKHKRSHASYVKAAKKGARTKRRNALAAGKSVPRRRRRSRKTVTVFTARRKPSSKRRSRYVVRRSVGRIKDRKGRSHRFYRYSVARKNPLGAMKSMAMNGAAIFGGYMGAKLVSNLISKYVVAKISAIPATIAPLVGPLGTFVLAAFAPKIVKKPSIVNAIQTGAAIGLFKTVLDQFVMPALVKSAPSVAGLLAGIDDMGIQGYGGEYVASRPALGMGGFQVSEAMALDEYVERPALGGFDVTEALADTEVDALQSGYAAGSLRGTVFSSK